ncbi:hypothetical protein LX36DRAFT_708881 [Colletotrichum falcatum]|nr:hypothetical protein LX36DRAFT_708881 [Colletotrichum falcatum]
MSLAMFTQRDFAHCLSLFALGLLPSQHETRGKIYSGIPNVTIKPLVLSDDDLNTRRMNDLMAVGEGGSMPLYLRVVNRILRDMRTRQQVTGAGFRYAEFKRCLGLEDLTPGQLNPLKQRLDTLESFTAKGAVGLANGAIGRVVALDEAHKYMKESEESQAPTNALLETIRLQRHLGVRVLTSTQEPTVSTKLLDLCSMTVVHRFTSPDWLRTLGKHLAGISSMSATATDEEDEAQGASPVPVGGRDPTMDVFKTEEEL